MIKEFNRDHDPNGHGGVGILIGIAMLWMFISVVSIIVGFIWWLMT